MAAWHEKERRLPPPLSGERASDKKSITIKLGMQGAPRISAHCEVNETCSEPISHQFLHNNTKINHVKHHSDTFFHRFHQLERRDWGQGTGVDQLDFPAPSFVGSRLEKKERVVFQNWSRDVPLYVAISQSRRVNLLVEILINLKRLYFFLIT